MTEKKKEIIKQLSSYTIATFLEQGVTMVAALAVRFFLGPMQTGIWSLLQVILNYASYAALGTTEAIYREIPFYLGKKDEERANRIKDTVYSFSSIMAIFVAIGIAIYAFMRREHLRTEIYYGLLGTAILVLLQRVQKLMISLLRAYKEFDLAGRQMVYSAIVNAALVAFFSFKFKIYGFMVAMGLSFLFNIVYIRIFHQFNFRWQCDWKIVLTLIDFGFPLMLLSLMETAFVTIDRIQIAAMLDYTQLGLYATAVMGYQYLAKIPSSMSVVMVPHFHERFGSTESKKDLENYTHHWAYASGHLMILMTAFAWFIGPLMIRIVLPKFVDCIPSLKCLLLSAYFFMLIQPYAQYLITVKKHLTLFPIIAASCVIAASANYIAIKAGWGIFGVSAATDLTYLIKFTLIYYFAYRHLFEENFSWKEYLLIIGRFSIMLAGLTLLEYFFSPIHSQFLRCVLPLGLVVLVYIPILFKMNKEMNILKSLKEKVHV